MHAYSTSPRQPSGRARCQAPPTLTPFLVGQCTPLRVPRKHTFTSERHVFSSAAKRSWVALVVIVPLQAQHRTSKTSTQPGQALQATPQRTMLQVRFGAHGNPQRQLWMPFLLSFGLWPVGGSCCCVKPEVLHCLVSLQPLPLQPASCGQPSAQRLWTATSPFLRYHLLPAAHCSLGAVVASNQGLALILANKRRFW